MSITQGGCGVPFLAPPVYEYLSSGLLSSININLDDLPHSDFKFVLQEVKKLVSVYIMYSKLMVAASDC